SCEWRVAECAPRSPAVAASPAIRALELVGRAPRLACRWRRATKRAQAWDRPSLRRLSSDSATRHVRRSCAAARGTQILVGRGTPGLVRQRERAVRGGVRSQSFFPWLGPY